MFGLNATFLVVTAFLNYSGDIIGIGKTMDISDNPECMPTEEREIFINEYLTDTQAKFGENLVSWDARCVTFPTPGEQASNEPQ